ncbi:MAG TPA: hypothetical protein VID47_13535 [Actinomycetota bacterium]
MPDARDRGSTTRGRRRRAALFGLAATVAFVGGAWVSGSISPLARRPILDGGATLPYRWVSPPANLASTNKAPDSARASLSFRGDRSDPDVVNTNDQQAEVVLGLGAIPKAPGARSVTVTIDPVDPSTIGPPPDHLSVLGNAYRFRVTYQPSGDAVTTFRTHPQVFLIWPAVGIRARDRTIISSPDGTSWTRMRTDADHSLLTAMAEVSSANGYFEVATTGHLPSPSPAGTGGAGGGQRGGGGGGGSVIPWVAVGAAIVVAGALSITRWRSRARDREYESYQRYRELDAPPATSRQDPDAPGATRPVGTHGKGAHRRRRRG